MADVEVRSDRRSFWLFGLFALLLALAAAAYSNNFDRETKLAKAKSSPVIVSPLTVVPPIPQPLIFKPLAPEDAKSINAGVPFAPERVFPARPFAFAGDAGNEERAITCLAAAAWYEAGDDRSGEQAVIQVVLNRVRHPAFPKSICGVVFQGAERSTGCQFTFTCDGSLVREPDAAAWQRARELAGHALTGFVMKSVGTATHYHADYVVPYWIDSLDKIAKVGPHLFYRWKGFWGDRAAFVAPPAGDEQLDQRVAHLDEPTIVPQPEPTMAVAEQREVASPEQRPPDQFPGLRHGTVKLADTTKAEFVVQLDPGAYAGAYALDALQLCGAYTTCSVVGWLRADLMAKELPLTKMNMAGAAFVYRKSGSDRAGAALWDCKQVLRTRQDQCLPSSNISAPATGSISTTGGGGQSSPN